MTFGRYQPLPLKSLSFMWYQILF